MIQRFRCQTLPYFLPIIYLPLLNEISMIIPLIVSIGSHLLPQYYVRQMMLLSVRRLPQKC